MIDYPKFAKMQNMFQRKNVLTSYGKVVVNTYVNVVDVNGPTKRKITK